MELKQYIKIIKQRANLILITAILTGFFAFVFSAILPTSYGVSLSLLIAKSNIQETDDYKYDSFYSIQASDLFANSIVGWLKSPEVVTDIYKKAGIDLPFKNLRKLEKNFKAFKASPHSIEIKFESKSRENAKNISEAIESVLKEKAELIKKTSQEEISFSIIGSEPIIVEKKPNLILNTIVGLISGIFLGILFAFCKEYFKE